MIETPPVVGSGLGVQLNVFDADSGSGGRVGACVVDRLPLIAGGVAVRRGG